MLLLTESLLTKRDEIMTAMKKWAREEGVQIEEDFMLEKQWFIDWQETSHGGDLVQPSTTSAEV